MTMTNVHDRDRAGRTPLHYAAIDGPRDQVNAWQETDPVRIAELHQSSVEHRLNNSRHLIDSGADVNAGDENGYTPLHFAVNADSVEVVRYLLDSGANLEAVNDKGETPLNIAVGNTTSGAGEIIQFLRDRGADPFRPANNGRSAIDYLRMIGSEAKRAPFSDLL